MSYEDVFNHTLRDEFAQLCHQQWRAHVENLLNRGAGMIDGSIVLSPEQVSALWTLVELSYHDLTPTQRASFEYDGTKIIELLGVVATKRTEVLREIPIQPQSTPIPQGDTGGNRPAGSAKPATRRSSRNTTARPRK